jgi:hypothetical protein
LGNSHPLALADSDDLRIRPSEGLVESRMPGNGHVRFGRRLRGNGPGESLTPRPEPISQHRPQAALGAGHAQPTRLRAGPSGWRGGGLTMSPLHPPAGCAGAQPCPGRSSPGPDGPCGGSIWTGPALRQSHGARENWTKTRSARIRVSTLSGEPRTRMTRCWTRGRGVLACWRTTRTARPTWPEGGSGASVVYPGRGGPPGGGFRLACWPDVSGQGRRGSSNGGQWPDCPISNVEAAMGSSLPAIVTTLAALSTQKACGHDGQAKH